MRVLSLNIWHGTCGSDLRDFLVSQLKETDIFCLQETNGEYARKMIRELFEDSQFSYEASEKVTDTDRYYSIHTIVKQPFRVSDAHTLFGSDDAATGHAMAVTISHPHNAPLVVMNVHGVPFVDDDKLDTDGRLRQSDEIIAWLQDKNAPSMICGDFNLLPEAESIKKFSTAGYRNLVADYGIATTRNRLAWERFPDNIQYFADYTFVSSELNVSSFSVPDIEVSDHLPMITDIKI